MASPALLPPPLLSSPMFPRLSALCGIIVGHLYGSHPSSLVQCGFLGSISGVVSLNYRVCQLGKQVRLLYTHSEAVSQHPFNLVHSDVWGPASFASKGGHHYYIMFIDDYSQHTWIYFISSCSEILSVRSLSPWFIPSFPLPSMSSV